MAPKKQQAEIEVPTINREVAEFYLVGETPLIFNSMSEKARRELLHPSGRKTAAQKKTSLKHDPMEEYRNSVYTIDDKNAPTLLAFPSPGFKKALAQAAVDIPGATKAAIGRLVRVHEYRVGIYGTPEIFTTTVRSADINKTPDMRTRAICPRWACKITVSYVRPLLSVQAITNLLAGAGEIVGIGDFRQEKGAGDFGLFRVATAADAEFRKVSKEGREEQALALKEPRYFDEETKSLLEWYDEQIAQR